MLTNAQVIRGRPTPKDVERFMKGSVRELKEKSNEKLTSSSTAIEQTMTRNDKTINSCTEKYYSDTDEYQTPDVKNSDAVKENKSIAALIYDKKYETFAILEAHVKDGIRSFRTIAFSHRSFRTEMNQFAQCQVRFAQMYSYFTKSTFQYSKVYQSNN